MRNYFSRKELRCKCGCGTVYISKRALAKVNRVREILGEPRYLSSAARCPVHNSRVLGRPLSQHRSTENRPSTAFDMRLIGATAEERAADKKRVIAAAIAAGFGGIGISYRTFVHMDDRGRRARW